MEPPLAIPAGACDTHAHVFGPFDRFPPIEPTTYPLPHAGAKRHRAELARMGCSRGVLTQPAPYANDPAAMLDAIAASDGTLRGVAIADSSIPTGRIAQWREQGILGLRFTEKLSPSGQPYPGSAGFTELESLAGIMRELGMHAQLWASAETLAEWLPRLVKLGVPIVVDHMGCPDPAAGAAGKDFEALLAISATEPQCYVKLSLCRVGTPERLWEDARPFHDAYLNAMPDRCLWGSDWPYVRLEPAPDAMDMLSLFMVWAGDPAKVRQVLVDNPAALYQFGEAE